MPSAINLARVVTDLLTKHSLALANEWVRLYQAQLHVFNAQEEIICINRFWRNQLGNLPFPTVSERECLDDRMATEDWLFNFERYVIPTIVQHQLPR